MNLIIVYVIFLLSYRDVFRLFKRKVIGACFNFPTRDTLSQMEHQCFGTLSLLAYQICYSKQGTYPPSLVKGYGWWRKGQFTTDFFVAAANQPGDTSTLTTESTSLSAICDGLTTQVFVWQFLMYALSSYFILPNRNTMMLFTKMTCIDNDCKSI